MKKYNWTISKNEKSIIKRYQTHGYDEKYKYSIFCDKRDWHKISFPENFDIFSRFEYDCSSVWFKWIMNIERYLTNQLIYFVSNHLESTEKHPEPYNFFKNFHHLNHNKKNIEAWKQNWSKKQFQFNKRFSKKKFTTDEFLKLCTFGEKINFIHKMKTKHQTKFFNQIKINHNIFKSYSLNLNEWRNMLGHNNSVFKKGNFALTTLTKTPVTIHCQKSIRKTTKSISKYYSNKIGSLLIVTRVLLTQRQFNTMSKELFFAIKTIKNKLKEKNVRTSPFSPHEIMADTLKALHAITIDTHKMNRYNEIKKMEKSQLIAEVIKLDDSIKFTSLNKHSPKRIREIIIKKEKLLPNLKPGNRQ